MARKIEYPFRSDRSGRNACCPRGNTTGSTVDRAGFGFRVAGTVRIEDLRQSQSYLHSRLRDRVELPLATKNYPGNPTFEHNRERHDR